MTPPTSDLPADVAGYIERLVTAVPQPFTPDQRARLAAILRPVAVQLASEDRQARAAVASAEASTELAATEAAAPSRRTFARSGLRLVRWAGRRKRS